MRFTSETGSYQVIGPSLRRVSLLDVFLCSLRGPLRLSHENHPPKPSTVSESLQAAQFLYTGDDTGERTMDTSDHTRAPGGDAHRTGTCSCCLHGNTETVLTVRGKHPETAKHNAPIHHLTAAHRCMTRH